MIIQMSGTHFSESLRFHQGLHDTGVGARSQLNVECSNRRQIITHRYGGPRMGPILCNSTEGAYQET